jgi:cytochrome P450
VESTTNAGSGSGYVEYPTTDPQAPVIECPYPYFHRMLEAEPVCRRPDREAEFLVFRHEDIFEVLKRQDLYSEVLPGGTLMDLDGETMIAHVRPPKHKEMRSFASRPLTPGRLRKLEPQIEGIVDALIDAFISRGEVELMYDFGLPLPARLMCELMGLPTEGDEWDLILRQWGETISSGESNEYWPNLTRYFAAKIDDRRKNPTADMLSELIQLQIDRDGEFNRAYVTVVATELMVGGAGTTALMIVNAMWLLLTHPEQLAKVRAQSSLIPAMLEESLRVESVIEDRERIALTDTELGGVVIPAGARIRMVLGAGNRDEKVFTVPDEFNVERGSRELKRHFGFGYGAHFCLGAPLARAEGRIAFERLFARLGEIRLSTRNDYLHVPNTHFRSFKALHLEFDPPEREGGEGGFSQEADRNSKGQGDSDL